MLTLTFRASIKAGQPHTLVAFADTIWKGKRNEALEREIAQQIARRCREETWEVYMKLDDIA